jgi:ABC-type transport system involved in cytochrome c biogenesis permease subunit
MFIIKLFNKVFQSIISPFFTSILLLLIITLLICGTIIQIRFGMSNAEKLIFNSWYFWAIPFIPLPGIKTAGLLLCLNLIARFIKSKLSFGKLSIHISILLIIVFALISSNSHKEMVLSVEEGQTISMYNNVTGGQSESAVSIPAKLRLDKFSIEKWPGSNTVRDYRSEIRISAPDGDQRAVISMNKPFQYHTCTFYQSSYTQQNGKNISIFYVVQSRTRIIPYICTLVFFIGIIFALFSFVKASSVQKKAVITLTIFSSIIFSSRNTQANTTEPEYNMSEFGKLMIVDEGRYQPVESFARYKIYQFRKECSIDSLSALQWIAELLFAPERAINRKIFSVNNQTILAALKIDKSTEHLYSYKDLYRLYSGYPVHISKGILDTIYGKSEPIKNWSFENYTNFEGLLLLNRNALANLGVIPSSETDLNLGVNSIYSLFPPEMTSDRVSLSKLTWLITEMTRSYRNHDPLSFNKSLNTLLLWEKEILGKPDFYRCVVENYYSKFRFIPAIKTCFFLVIFAFVLGLRGFKVTDIIPIMSISGLILMTVFLILRTVILERPPVVSMYETFITVSWLGSLSGILLYIKHSEKSILFVSSFLSLLFIYLAWFFGNEFSTMNAVPAVLNNNFWLTTHIFTIIAGYAAFIAVSVLGHIYLIQNYTNIRITNKIEPSALYRLALSALILTAAGTAIGGLWADMSWGRFWGWDPKENGALLLLLWGTLITHGYKSKIISSNGLAWGSAACAMLVMCTWIGVNLLGKGMHAYGFTSEGKAVLIGFLIFESVFMSIMFLKARITHLNISK